MFNYSYYLGNRGMNEILDNAFRELIYFLLLVLLGVFIAYPIMHYSMHVI